jgi:hypothetical protein
MSSRQQRQHAALKPTPLSGPSRQSDRQKQSGSALSETHANAREQQKQQRQLE